MTVLDPDAVPLIAGAHRLIRALAPGEGPYVGDLVSSGEDICVRADAALWKGWEGWRFSGAEHVAAPLDLVRRADGQDVLLPWCTERATVFLGRRRAAGEPIDLGEVSTLVASVLRGMDELGEQLSSVRGDWWLTSAGRPVLVLGDGDAALAASVRVLTVVRETQLDRTATRLLERLGEALADARRVLPARDRWEGELFELAAPRALRTTVYAPAAARSVRAAFGGEQQSGAEFRRGSLADAVAPSADDAADTRFIVRWMGRLTRVGESLRERGERRAAVGTVAARVPAVENRDAWGTRISEKAAPLVAPRWRKPAVVGGATAVLLIAGGVLWPSAEPHGATAVTLSDVAETSGPTAGQAEEPERAAPAETAAEAPNTASPSAQTDALAALTALLAPAQSCAEGGDLSEPSCVEVWAVPSAESASALRARPGNGGLTLVEDYGDLAAVRWDPDAAEGASQMSVMIRTDEKWRVRDVYDVADPPSH